jgi:undecaprenyl-diphosphatase
LFGGVTEDVVGHEELAQQDPHWHQLLVDHRLAGLSGISRVLTYLGGSAFAYVLIGTAVAIVIWRKRDWAAVLALPALFVGQFICAGVSGLVDRQRPPEIDWLTSAYGRTFPSCHAATAVLTVGLVVTLAWPWLPARSQRITAVTAGIVIGAIAGATRAYLGTNWPTDVVAGWALGGLLLTLAITGVSLLRRHSVAAWRRHRPSEEFAAVDNRD